MQKLPIDSSDAVRKYYAAFPALRKGQQSPMHYLLKPPAWCRKPLNVSMEKVTMQKEILPAREWNQMKNRRVSTGKERRNSYHGQRKHNNSKKRCHSYSRSLESKENLPEWVTHEGVWDIETQDPVKEFIKAIALDEGYGTCENTITDEILGNQNKMHRTMNTVPDCDDDISLDHRDWVLVDDYNVQTKTPLEEEMYAKFEAKFNRSIEALWSKDQANTPDDECQELPVDFQDLLSSPSDRMFNCSSVEKCGPIPLTDNIWSVSEVEVDFATEKLGSWSCIDDIGKKRQEYKKKEKENMDILNDKLQPLNIKDESSDKMDCTLNFPIKNAGYASDSDTSSCGSDKRNIGSLWGRASGELSSLYNYKDVYDSMPSVTNVMQSLSTLNHSKQYSSFTEVLPKWRTGFIGDGRVGRNELCKFTDMKIRNHCPADPIKGEEDLLTSMRTHFRPIKKESTEQTSNNIVRYADGTTFTINSELDNVKYERTESGTLFLESESEPPKQYMELRTRDIDYNRLNLTKEQCEANCEMTEGQHFTLKFRVKQTDRGIQTEDPATFSSEVDEASPAKKMMFNSATVNSCNIPDSGDSIGILKSENKAINIVNNNPEAPPKIEFSWKICNECKANNNNWMEGNQNIGHSGLNLLKIWSTDDVMCEACSEYYTMPQAGGNVSKTINISNDESSKEWEELLSDISYIHKLYIGDGHRKEDEEDASETFLTSYQVSYSVSVATEHKSALTAAVNPEILSKNCKNMVKCYPEECSYPEVDENVENNRMDRKRRHSATQVGKPAGAGWLIYPLPHNASFLACLSADRPLTR